MKTKAFLSLLLAVTQVMLLSVAGSVNISPSDYSSAASVLVASGSPGPSPTPNVAADPFLMASGSPGPAPVPSATLAA